MKLWLTLQQVQVAVLTETRWSFTSTWQDSGWHHIHSADPTQRGSGVLVLVSRTLCAEQDLRWHEVIPGRLVHVRFLNGTRNIDVLGCYQHVYKKDHEQLNRREKFWQALDAQLSKLPSRNTMVLMGDLNCCLHASAGTCGGSDYHWKHAQIHGTCHSDNARFLQVLRTGGLVALNSWNARLGPTYVHQYQTSRIDYGCTRQQHADGAARNVQYLWQAPFLPPGKHGHVPLLFHVALYWIPPAHHMGSRLTPHQRLQGPLAKMANHPDWHTFLDASEWDIWHELHLARTSGSLDLQTVHDVAMKHFSHVFHAASKPANPDHWKCNPVTITKWEHRHKAMMIHQRDLPGFFHAWFHVTRFLHLKRKHQRGLPSSYDAKDLRRR